ncbi:MAG: GntR family transcriptional regulator, partial [Chloroflexota bacterium]|nr:GntR family transcriptional regulator [Chloroflexota bacterium]
LYCQVVTEQHGPPFPYQRIVDDVRTAILSGRLAPGARLHSEWEMAKQYATSRPTVRRAVARLKAEGLVVSEQGRGTFVRPKPHVRLLLTGGNLRRHRAAGLSGFNAQVVEQGQRPAQRLLEVATISAPPEVSMRLDVDEEGLVVVRRRLFLVEEQPVALCDSYYPAHMVAGTAIAEARLIRGGALAVIEDPEGPIRRQAARSVDELVGAMPTRTEIEQLGLALGVPVMRILRTIYDAEEAPLEVQATVAAADRHEFRYEVDMR